MAHVEVLQYDPVRLPGFDFVKTQTDESWDNGEWTFYSGRYAHYIVYKRRASDIMGYDYGKRRQKVALSFQFEVQPDQLERDLMELDRPRPDAAHILSDTKTEKVSSWVEISDLEQRLMYDLVSCPELLVSSTSKASRMDLGIPASGISKKTRSAADGCCAPGYDRSQGQRT